VPSWVPNRPRRICARFSFRLPTSRHSSLEEDCSPQKSWPGTLRRCFRMAYKRSGGCASPHGVTPWFIPTDYVSESFHDHLAGESETIFDSHSSRGSHHPSWNASWWTLLRGASKAPTRGTLPRMSPMTEPRRGTKPHCACGWSSCGSGKMRNTSQARAGTRQTRVRDRMS
jgi:hypothetical protein